MGEVVGRICADGHARIWHREPTCPACALRLENEKIGMQSAQLTERVDMLTNDLDTALAQLRNADA